MHYNVYLKKCRESLYPEKALENNTGYHGFDNHQRLDLLHQQSGK